VSALKQIFTELAMRLALAVVVVSNFAHSDFSNRSASHWSSSQPLGVLVGVYPDCSTHRHYAEPGKLMGTIMAIGVAVAKRILLVPR